MLVLETDFTQTLRYPQPFTCCLGYFDGLHKGHQALIHVAQSLGLPVGVLTFDRNPKKDRPVTLLTPLSIKKTLLERWHVDVLLIVQFNDYVASLSPKEFLTSLKAFGITHVVVGTDFRFGHHAEGNVDTLRADPDLTVHVVEPRLYHDQKVSTSTILNRLQEGKMYDVTAMLGRPYQVKGYVGHGMRKGTELGYPTANVILEEPFFLPRNGVYIVAFEWQSVRYYALASLGYHPTVANLSLPSLEVHVLDFSDNLYEQHVSVEFLEFIRDEQKFPSLDALISQMHADKAYAMKQKKNLFSSF
jgi:riboflavin kinase / FMN adenylyltransferase